MVHVTRVTKEPAYHVLVLRLVVAVCNPEIAIVQFNGNRKIENEISKLKLSMLAIAFVHCNAIPTYSFSRM